jgi:transcriptional regulator with XRE-family HTH domain
MEPTNTSDKNGQGALGRALRGLRQRAGITQEELGARVGIDPTYISRVEGRRINLRWGTLQRFLRALDATVADLGAAWTEDGSPTGREPIRAAGSPSLEPRSALHMCPVAATPPSAYAPCRQRARARQPRAR